MNYKISKSTHAMKREIMNYKQEFLDCGDSMDGTGPLRQYDFEEWMQWNQACEKEETLPESWLVPSFQYVCLEGERVVGLLQFRLRLNDYLLNYGGHVGYSTRPSERNKKVATFMMQFIKEETKRLGYSQLLVTCLEDNEASRKTILKSGGVYEDTRYEANDKVNLERYWITL